MRVELDAKVRTKDGHDAGNVRSAVFDPQASEITHFVIATGGLFGRDVLVPREQLENASRAGDPLSLELTRAELERMEDYLPSRYTAPPDAWAPPVAYGYPAAGYLWPLGYTGATSPVAPSEEALRGVGKGAVVVDAEGDDIGVVDDVRFDRTTGRLQGIVLRAGAALVTLVGGGELVELDATQIMAVDRGRVRLRIAKEEFERGRAASRRG
ncbi:MAG: PRC-barrel domain-containing protein [Candidatus Limnocylindria bacterium]